MLGCMRPVEGSPCAQQFTGCVGEGNGTGGGTCSHLGAVGAD